MRFRLLIETHAYTTIRELHVTRVTGPLDDLKREKLEVLNLEPLADEGTGGPFPTSRTEQEKLQQHGANYGRLDDLTDIDKQGTQLKPKGTPSEAASAVLLPQERRVPADKEPR